MSEVTITDEARIPDFERVFGTTTVPVKELLPVPSLVALPGFAERQAVFMLDLDRLTPEQTERLIAYSMERFGMTRAECEAELPKGFPVLASSCVFVTDPLDFL